MKVIILNAGKGVKLSNVLQNKPKCLLEIEDNTLLEIQINTLYNCGINDISVIRGYAKEYIDIPGIKYYDNDDYEDTNVLYSLFCAREELNDEVLILYGDILFDEDTINRILASKHDIAIGVMINTDKYFAETKVDYSKKEMLIFDAENNVEQIGKELLNINDYNSGLFTGIIKCSKKGTMVLKNNYDRIKEIKESKNHLDYSKLKKSWITDLLNELCKLGVPLQCVIIEKGWMEIDTLEDYNKAKNDIKFIGKLVKVKTDWEQRAQTYDNIKWVNRNETLGEMIDFAGNVNCKNILDVGTGTGKVLKSLKEKYPKGNYYGVDLSEGMMSKIDRSLGFNLLQSKIEDLSIFEDDFFDRVTARMVIHHSEDLNKAFNEIRRVLKPGGKFIVCEGTPPDRYSVKFYEEMFKYKENRHTFLVDDLTNLFVNSGFNNIIAKTIILNNMSLNNWLNNAGVPFRNIDIIRKMHFEADKLVKQAYNMKIVENDIIMNWKFAVICGTK
ncbi:methyltransferase domain-containing protein [Clostridium sp. ZBS12]|uniref:methyltransferase domain-containing protein n=1 Tax=Clostridium sp. ZBS12 TaxID=2949972 RepID=UPI00207AB4E9|nr:methyltransferase domain-containing protein [Clostridium sp. ZBS12]